MFSNPVLTERFGWGRGNAIKGKVFGDKNCRFVWSLNAIYRDNAVLKLFVLKLAAINQS